jgi:hypothetical protein
MKGISLMEKDCRNCRFKNLHIAQEPCKKCSVNAILYGYTTGWKPIKRKFPWSATEIMRFAGAAILVILCIFEHFIELRICYAILVMLWLYIFKPERE